MKGKIGLRRLKDAITRNKKLAFIMFSFVTILMILVNLSYTHSSAIGIVALSIYFFVNSTFWGDVFFEKENRVLRFTLGTLLLLVFLGLTSWAFMIVYNLDFRMTVLVLSIVAGLPILVRVKSKQTQHESEPGGEFKKKIALSSYITRLLYVLTVAILFYLLYVSRADEVHTVWQFMHPLFMPIFFVATFLLLIIVLSAERIQYKLLFIIAHSILLHTFFVIIFPAGDVSYQARILAVTRSLFDNNVLHGWPPEGASNLLTQIWFWCRGTNFQSALSIVLARTLNVDISWVHLFLVPTLWGAFVPIATFMVTRILCQSERTALLSSLAISLFPSTIYYGAISVPNCLGYIFFFFSLFFILRYLSSTGVRNSFLMTVFLLVSFLSHFLTGMMAFSLFLFAVAFKTYLSKKNLSILNLARPQLLIPLILTISIIPLALVYQRFFIPYKTSFTLYRFYKIPFEELTLRLIFGGYVDFWIPAATIHLIAPIFGLLGMLYCLTSRTEGSKRNQYLCLFLISGFLIALVDYRVLKFFMIRVPFNEERLWMFRDFLAVPFVAILGDHVLTRLRSSASRGLNNIHLLFQRSSLTYRNLRAITISIVAVIYVASYVLSLLFAPALTVASVYYSYPHHSPLQTTSYELEAAIYIDENSSERYVVISDVWFAFAGQIIVGLYNPSAYYFGPRDPKGWSLFLEMKNDPRTEPMIKAMNLTDATVAYFIIEKPRLGEEAYNRVIQQAQQNKLQTYKIFYYKNEEKLRIFYYEK